MDGWMDTNIYIACLRQVVAFAPKVINAPPTASHKEGVEVWVDRWAERWI
jgi:hypothetical protein